MPPKLQVEAGSGPVSAGVVSLQALTDLVVLVLLTFAGATLLLFLSAMAAAAWGLAGLTTSDGASIPWINNAVLLGSMASPLAWIAWRWRSLHIAPTTTLASGAALGVLAGVLAVAVSCSTHWLGQWTGNDSLPRNAESLDQLQQESWLLAALMLVVIAPITEEMVFRKFLLARFLKSGYPLLGIALTSVLFGLMHEPFPGAGQSIAGWALLLLNYSVMGALFAAAYCLTGRVLAAILAHATNNFIATAMYWGSM